MIDVVILGSTGSIGTQALEVIRQHPGEFRVLGLAAGGANLDLLAEQILEFGPELVALGVQDANQPSVLGGLGGLDGLSVFAQGASTQSVKDIPRGRGTVDAANSTSQSLSSQSESNLLEALRIRGVKPGDSRLSQILTGSGAVETVAGNYPEATVLNGITGGVGLGATLAALKSGAQLALANKESLVVGGALVKQAQVFPGQVVPVDSEHSAIAQSLLAGVHEKGMTSPIVTGRSEVLELVLTASGGPFRGRKTGELSGIRAQDALNHPTWQMGPVVTVNSSTLMNKGLELIEAALLFDLPASQITPVIHPQSIVHSAVTWQDGASVLQASFPDMKIPIALGLTWRAREIEKRVPPRLSAVCRPLTWSAASQWTFEPIDHQTFPALELAKFALEASPTHPAVMNAANEVCAHAFLQDHIEWLDIIEVVTGVVHEHEGVSTPDLTEVLAVTDWATRRAMELVQRLKG